MDNKRREETHVNCCQARSCPYAKNKLLALKHIITDIERIPLFQYN